MPFWAGGWANPYVEPKRPYRFIVPFPVVVPSDFEAGQGLISELFVNSRFRGNKYGDGTQLQYFDFPCVRCKKPGYTTQLYKANNVVMGYAPYLPNAPASFEFTPVELELVDTYDFDLEATLTAYLYGAGELPSGGPGVPTNGTPRSIKITNIGTESRDFQIIELLDTMAINGPSRYPPSPITQRRGGKQIGHLSHGSAKNFQPLDAVNMAGVQEVPGEQRMFRARRFILRNTFISGVQFGEHSQETNALSKVTVQLVYDRFDYEWILYRPPEELAKILWEDVERSSILKHNPARLNEKETERLRRLWESLDAEKLGTRTEAQEQQVRESELAAASREASRDAFSDRLDEAAATTDEEIAGTTAAAQDDIDSASETGRGIPDPDDPSTGGEAVETDIETPEYRGRADDALPQETMRNISEEANDRELSQDASPGSSGPPPDEPDPPREPVELGGQQRPDHWEDDELVSGPFEEDPSDVDEYGDNPDRPEGWTPLPRQSEEEKNQQLQDWIDEYEEGNDEISRQG